MNVEKLNALQIDRLYKRRPTGTLWIIFTMVIVATLGAVYFARPKAGDDVRRFKTNATAMAGSSASPAPAGAASGAAPKASSTNTGREPVAGNVALTVSGYIINRERIEISPRFMGVVQWIGVKKGDAVTNGQVVVLLDDTEYRARLMQADGAVANARVNVAKAELDAERVSQLAKTDIASKEAMDNARLGLDAARAALKEVEGAHALAQTYVDWCTIRSPINGVVLEKLVDPNELV